MLTRHPAADQRAAEAAAVAAELRRSAVSLRRDAGRLTYHPAAGRRPDAGPGLTASLAAIERLVSAVQQGAGDRVRDETAAATAPDAERLRSAHATVDEGAQVILAALTVLRAVLAGPDGASLDAPYGSGAPRLHHPGALCTIVAERAERLAHALEMVAVLKANLDRAR